MSDHSKAVFVSDARESARLVLAFETALATLVGMKDVTFTYWQDGDYWIGHLDEFPDYMTQGSSLEDLKEHLADLHADLTAGMIPHVRRHAKLQVA